MKHLPLTVLLFAVCGAQDGPKPEAMSLLGKPLHAAALPAETRVRLEANLATARAEFEKNPASADAAIWLGRRTAYLGRFRDAIAIYSTAIAKHPGDARLYRHRGHRYITVREFDNAIADLSKAASLVADTPDEVEPDGQPNARNIPTGTLKTNIYYHLGLAHYLKGDFEARGRGLSVVHAALEECRHAGCDGPLAVHDAAQIESCGGGEESARADHGRPWTCSRTARTTSCCSCTRERSPKTRCWGCEDRRASMRQRSVTASPTGTCTTAGRAEALKLLGEIVEQNATQWAAFGYIASEAELARARCSGFAFFLVTVAYHS